jgi:hypothetical protein
MWADDSDSEKFVIWVGAILISRPAPISWSSLRNLAFFRGSFVTGCCPSISFDCQGSLRFLSWYICAFSRCSRVSEIWQHNLGTPGVKMEKAIWEDLAERTNPAVAHFASLHLHFPFRARKIGLWFCQKFAASAGQPLPHSAGNFQHWFAIAFRCLRPRRMVQSPDSQNDDEMQFISK